MPCTVAKWYGVCMWGQLGAVSCTCSSSRSSFAPHEKDACNADYALQCITCKNISSFPASLADSSRLPELLLTKEAPDQTATWQSRQVSPTCRTSSLLSYWNCPLFCLMPPAWSCNSPACCQLQAMISLLYDQLNSLQSQSACRAGGHRCRCIISMHSSNSCMQQVMWYPRLPAASFIHCMVTGAVLHVYAYRSDGILCHRPCSFILAAPD